MAFKSVPPAVTVPDSPEKLILDLPRRKIKGVLLHQGEMMQAYASAAVNDSDVALQLPTGSGKTLVGLMIAEWRRRKFQERIVYLCPTKQLVNQVVEQAEETYGLTVRGFTGPINSFDPTAKAEYQNGDRVAITTYSALFNTNPFFANPQVIIVDDAHAAENYIAALWSLRVQRGEHPALHTALANLLKPFIEPGNFARLTGQWSSAADASWADKLPTPALAKIAEELRALLDTYTQGTDLRYSWSVMRDHLLGCQLYMSSQDILLRPLIPPTWTHAPFADAKQRIFMSATLGAGGDLERLTGRPNIKRLPVPGGWDRQGIGRRYFVFPGMGLKDTDVLRLRRELMKRAGRSLVLVPSERAREEYETDVAAHLGYNVFNAADIEESKKVFTSEPKAVAIVANRYDGIDFPGDDCRLLFVDGLPRAMNSQERFLMTRMGANALFNERIQTRVLQAIGRCTRSLEDYSAVVIVGDDVPTYLAERERRKYLHPELQAELEFGIEQSKGTSVEDLVENFDIFLKNDVEWEVANGQILAKRSAAVQQKFPAMQELQDAVRCEIEYQQAMWKADYQAALSAAERTLTVLLAPELKGYRTLWHYLAGSAAALGSAKDGDALAVKSRDHFAAAKRAASIPWLVELSRYHPAEEDAGADRSAVFEQLERTELLLEKLGKLHDGKFNAREREIIEGLDSTSSGVFERAHVMLGEMLGFVAGKKEEDASPDPWWAAGKVCLVFEDHAGASSASTLDATKARQASTHPDWIKANVPLREGVEIFPVLVTPVKKAMLGAMPHLDRVLLWPLDEFRAWAKNALAQLRELRRNFSEPGDLVWRSEAAEIFERHGMDVNSLLGKLKQTPAGKILKI